MTQAKNDQPKSRIPEFSSREEEAKFWDTHDVTDYWDELTPVEVCFTGDIASRIVLELDPETLDELRARARERGVKTTPLARTWLLERLQEQKS